MGGKAELQSGTANCLEIGVGKILLAEMDEIAALLDGELPVVVDDELGAMGGADRFAAADLARAGWSLMRNCTSRTPSGTSRSIQSALSTIR